MLDKNMLDLHGTVIHENSIKEDAKKIFAKLRPSWSPDLLRIKEFTGGLTNKLYGCYIEGEPEENMILVRIYGKGTEIFINRHDELEMMLILHAAGIGPPVYARFKNGICYGFVPGTSTENCCTEEPLSRLVAKEMARTHSVDPTQYCPSNQLTKAPKLFQRIRNWLQHAPTVYKDQARSKRLQEEIPARDVLWRDVDILEKHIQCFEWPMVLCHNDLVSENIVYNKEKGAVTFIDWEYGAVNFEAFDIASYFKGFAGTVDSDFSLYPSKEFQFNWMREYLYHKNNTESPDSVPDKDIQRLYVQTSKMALVCLFYEAVWALVCDSKSDIEFDYLSFAKRRFDEFYARREEYFALDIK